MITNQNFILDVLEGIVSLAPYDKKSYYVSIQQIREQYLKKNTSPGFVPSTAIIREAIVTFFPFYKNRRKNRKVIKVSLANVEPQLWKNQLIFMPLNNVKRLKKG